MKRGERMRRDAQRRYLVYRLKFLELFHLYKLWNALNSATFQPPNLLSHESRDFADSVRTACLSWFATLVDQSKDGMNAFHLWGQLFPKHSAKISAVWVEIEPHWKVIRTFRDRAGFHADSPQQFFRAKYDIRNRDVVESLQRFLRLAKFLHEKESEELPDFRCEVEALLNDLDVPINPHPLELISSLGDLSDVFPGTDAGNQ